MTNEDKITRIAEIIKEYDFDKITKIEFERAFESMTVSEIKEELWEMYCFINDVTDTINM